MAWLIDDHGNWKVGFRYAGKLYKRSLKTSSASHADLLLGRINGNLADLELGRLELPAEADILTFLLTDGRKTTAKPQVVLRLSEMLDKYVSSLPVDSKESNSLYTEKIHINHLKRLLGEDVPVRSLTVSSLQEYVNKRAKETGRRKHKIKPQTIKKEINTFAMIWNRAVKLGQLQGKFPSDGLSFPKGMAKEPFRTVSEIEQQIKREKRTPEQAADLWDSVYLRLPEIKEVLDCVKAAGGEDAIYAMFCFAAYTGARRSEIMRSKISDFDLDGMTVRIQEKKKDREKVTFRMVPLVPELAIVMKDWFGRHPGGSLTICERPNIPLSPQIAHARFEDAIRGTPWQGKLRGWHVFRHSFASNCAMRGVDQRKIDLWMGHQTEEMRRRYQHLFPEDQRDALRSVFS